MQAGAPHIAAVISNWRARRARPRHRVRAFDIDKRLRRQLSTASGEGESYPEQPGACYAPHVMRGWSQTIMSFKTLHTIE
jgi:hypothetical protein